MSHLHVRWMTEEEVISHSTEGESKLQRYKSRMKNKGGLLPTQSYLEDAFDP